MAEANANHRISQFTADGEFVRAWGWDVVDSGPGNDVAGTPNEFEICVAANGDVCKAGILGAAAGQLANPSGIAIDQASGYVYVTSTNNRRVDVFSGTGQFAGAFGWDVDSGGVVGPEVCTTTCKAAGTAGGDAGRFGALGTSVPAIDPNVAGRVYVPDPGNLRVAHYETSIVAGTLTSATFVKAFGWDVDPVGGTGLEACTTICKTGVAGAGAGQFTAGSPGAVAVDSAGGIYATSGPIAGNCTATAPCRVQRFAPDASSAADFGPASGTGQLRFEAGTAQTVAAFNLAVDPSNDHVFVQRRASSTSYQVLEYDSDGTYLETHPGGDALTAATSNAAPGLAVGLGGRIYANLGTGVGVNQVFILGPVPPPTVTIEPVTGVGTTTATFNGTVEIPAPGSPTFDTTYRFEYSSNGVDWTSVPLADANVGDGTTGVHAVSESVSGLQPNTLYAVRLVATTGPTATSSTVSFTTAAAPPRVALTFVDDVTQTDARLGAHIDPEGLSTTYHFEWGPTTAYGNRVPAFERQLGDGTTAVVATEPIAGLAGASVYHYRVVATSAGGRTDGPDRTFETLNSCGLTDNRCYELVSPSDKGAVGAAGDVVALGKEQNFQVAPDGSAVQYVIAYGAGDSRSGEEASYVARRDGAGWSSEELGVPQSGVNPRAGVDDPSQNLGLSADLSCGFFSSTEAAAADAPRALLEAGGAVLYRRNADGSWTTVTTEAPVETAIIGERLFEYEDAVAGLSEVAPFEECERVVFRSPFRYPGVPGVGVKRTYLWDRGLLSDVGLIPGPGGPEVAAALVGASMDPDRVDVSGQPLISNAWNAVSGDGSRVYFTAHSRLGGDVGQQAVFLREDGLSLAVDVSQSRTATANDDDSVYQTASEDGSRAVFTARTGLAANDPALGPASCLSPKENAPNDGAGCDLYVYSVGGDGIAGTGDDTLTDLSVPGPGTSNPTGAGVVGVLDASDDGQQVYFAARGQLVAGEGYTAAENLARDTYSVYHSDAGEIDYVGRIDDDEQRPFVAQGRSLSLPWTSRATPDGRHLVFESRANPTDYDSNGNPEAYVYDADSETLECVTCRRDGQPPAALDLSSRLTNPQNAQNLLSPPRVISDDGSRVFFVSRMPFATGATAGRLNLYQWEDGQVSFISGSVDTASVSGAGGLRYGGASADGDNVFFRTGDQLTWQDRDGKTDIYVARPGGGIPQPPAAAPPCDPLGEQACQGPGSGSPSAVSEETSRGKGGEPAAVPRASFAMASLTRAQRARLARGASVRVVVRVNRAGRISARGVAKIGRSRARVLSASVRAPRAGRYSMRLRLTRAAVRQLRHSKALRVRLAVRFAGASKANVRRITLQASKRTATTDRRASK